ncbi:MAG TPA: ankyrin repeat domain-containing protein [Pyrinomonadaceae bacterium]|nr:ankyrin repeat domain-containing protein [Pyrinomonadaceae bacterium]
MDKTAELAAVFLENACGDPLLANGPAAHARRSNTALRMLKRYPEIAGHSIHTAVVCGDIEEVERLLAKRPEAACEPGGPQRRRHLKEREQLWTPLLHLCYGRLPLAAAADNAVAIARVLLDHGANPNDYFEVGDGPHRYTALCGVAGEGEDDAPPHPQRNVLARLLLDRGADPYDTQLFYNTHFHGDILWILEPLYESAAKSGRPFDSDSEWSGISLGGYGHGARFLLTEAIVNNNLELAEWLLKHGASPNAAPPPHPNQPKHSLHEEALRRGNTDIADLLVRYGATPSQFVRDGVDAFTDICLRLDENEARALIAEHPECLRSTVPIFTAAKRDRSDVVALLLDLGTPIEIADDTQVRPLHVAAYSNALNVAQLLIDRGANLEAVESTWNNTPFGFATYANMSRMIELISKYSTDVFRLTWTGNIERLKEVLSVQPELAKLADGSTPLMWLPDDDGRAMEAVKLLVRCGADPAVKSNQGLTAADYARKWALYDTADLLELDRINKTDKIDH